MAAQPADQAWREGITDEAIANHANEILEDVKRTQPLVGEKLEPATLVATYEVRADCSDAEPCA